MRIDIVTLMPDWVESLRHYGVTGRALRDGLVDLRCWTPRDFTDRADGRVDDRSYGGGPGMVMQAAPLRACLDAIADDAGGVAGPTLLMSPQGVPLDQPLAARLAGEPGLRIICGRYEGIDQRFVDARIDLEISVGDFVLSGGELPAMLLVDAIARLQPGALGDSTSAAQDSFSHGLLDHPHYTRPAADEAGDVPAILFSGDHGAIERWRLKQALGQTWLKRPDLLQRLTLSEAQTALLREFISELETGDGA
jgi:tRNA (guanine37-N1)-methyltransferase